MSELEPQQPNQNQDKQRRISKAAGGLRKFGALAGVVATPFSPVAAHAATHSEATPLKGADTYLAVQNKDKNPGINQKEVYAKNAKLMQEVARGKVKAHFYNGVVAISGSLHMNIKTTPIVSWDSEFKTGGLFIDKGVTFFLNMPLVIDMKNGDKAMVFWNNVARTGKNGETLPNTTPDNMLFLRKSSTKHADVNFYRYSDSPASMVDVVSAGEWLMPKGMPVYTGAGLVERADYVDSLAHGPAFNKYLAAHHLAKTNKGF